MSENYKKTLIQPKVRLLLRIYLKGYPKASEKKKKMQQELRYDKGKLSGDLKALVLDGLIESQNPNKIDPPYRVTAEGKRYLGPIIFTLKIGSFLLSWIGLWTVMDYVLLAGHPALLATVFLPLILFGFLAAALILMFYPYLLLKGGKIHYRQN